MLLLSVLILYSISLLQILMLSVLLNIHQTETSQMLDLKVTGIRSMVSVLNRGPLEGILTRNVKFFGKERNY